MQSISSGYLSVHEAKTFFFNNKEIESQYHSGRPPCLYVHIRT